MTQTQGSNQPPASDLSQEQYKRSSTRRHRLVMECIDLLHDRTIRSDGREFVEYRAVSETAEFLAGELKESLVASRNYELALTGIRFDEPND